MKLRHLLFLISCSIFLFASCSVSKQISKQADIILLNDTAIGTGHIGISIYEPATNTYWYNYNATKNFIPASNTKLFTLYAGMKYLGDSLVGARLSIMDTSITIYPSADPTFLNSEFRFQPVFKKLKAVKNILVITNFWKADALGNGWAWNDYNESYMAERSSFPIYGNLVNFTLRENTIDCSDRNIKISSAEPIESAFHFNALTNSVSSGNFKIERLYGNNEFSVRNATSSFKQKSIPFKTNPKYLAKLLSDSLKTNSVFFLIPDPLFNNLPDNLITIHSQPTDSLFKPMMHRSDNFFAEQTLLMASNEYLGYMSDEKMIDTILKTSLKDLPQKPKWVDGSGLSRYNLCTPQTLVYLLNKMKNEFGWERVKNILPTGGTGTLSSYYKKDSNFIYAKTGTLSNNCALSGYLITQKGKLLVFSVLANNYQGGATPVRRAVEKFLRNIRKNY